MVGGLAAALLLDSPDRERVIAELYAGRELLAVLTRLLNDTVWCDHAGEYILIGDPVRVFLAPKSAC